MTIREPEFQAPGHRSRPRKSGHIAAPTKETTITSLQRSAGNQSVASLISVRARSGALASVQRGSHGKKLYAHASGTYVPAAGGAAVSFAGRDLLLSSNVRGHGGHADYTETIKRALKDDGEIPRNVPSANITITEYSTFTR
jgi:hypothetical protein